MSYKANMSVANFTCRFGDDYVLLDFFQEIVKPAFFDSPPREYRKNQFYLFDLEFVDAGENSVPNPVIIGRFVRDTQLERNYVLRNNNLVIDKDKMESATSAKFVLILSTHTLLYVTETPYAPPTSMFRSNIQHHLNWSWKNFINQKAKKSHTELNANKPRSERISLKEIKIKLTKEFPRPELEINERPTQLSINDFLDKFQKINKVEYRIFDTNHSPDFTPLLRQLRQEKAATESSKIIVIENNPKNKDGISKQLHDATADGNVKAIVEGKNMDGGKLKGSNDKFRISLPLENIPHQIRSFGRFVLARYSQMLSDGDIIVHQPDVKDKINSINSDDKLNG